MQSSDIDELRTIAAAWADDDPDVQTREELRTLLASSDATTLREHVGTRLQFGTAGLRGLIGPGPNRMNRSLVRRVGAGLAAYLLRTVPDATERGVVVGGDARHMSAEFVEDTTRVLCGAGIRVHRFEEYVATPVLAYAVRQLGACAGVIVTASHNPPEYNGYKVYWENGAQIVPPHDKGISECIDAVGSVIDLPLADLEVASEEGWARLVPDSCLKSYWKDVEALRCHPELGLEGTVVYTPLHGVGARFVEEILERAHARRLHVVRSQREPDGDFPTVRFPNPEEEGAMDRALELANEVKADLVLANDPDADRLAVALPDPSEPQGYRMLSGNEIGCLLAYYLLTQDASGTSPRDRLVMTTIVSSRMLRRMAEELSVNYDETLTGFKWIANAGQRHHREQGWRFVMGYEEALGYTVGPVVADKDGISAALLFCEMSAWCRQNGRRLSDLLVELYRRFGLHSSRQHSLTLPGTEGATRIADMMRALRADPPPRCGRYRVERITDYLEPGTGLPLSNVLAFDLEGGTGRVLARPSGTEPKIKFYFELRRDIEDENFGAARAELEQRLDSLVDEFLADRGVPR